MGYKKFKKSVSVNKFQLAMLIIGFIIGSFLISIVIHDYIKQTHKERSLPPENKQNKFLPSLTFDNIKKYNEPLKQVTIKNAFGLGEDIITAQLKTPTIYKVPIGYHKVAEIEVTPKADIQSIIDSFQLIDLKNNQTITRKIDLKVKKLVKKEVNDYGEICYNVINKTTKKSYKVCHTFVNGTKFIDRVEWIDFNKSMLKLGTPITIGLFTDVQKGDKIEWIPKIQGVEITEWAVWTESLTSGGVFFYNMDSNSTITDELGNYTGTNHGTDQVAGKINNALDFEKSDNDWVGTGFIQDSRSFAFSLWVKFESFSSVGIYDNVIINDENTFGGTLDYILRCGSNSNSCEWVIHDGSSAHSLNLGSGFQTGKWYHFVVTYDNASQTSYVYINGTKIGSVSGGLGNRNSENDIEIGMDSANGRYFDGVLDMVYYWNRNLTEQEISDLWNDGNGLTYNETGGGTSTNTAPVVTLNSPADSYSSTNQSVIFNCSAYSDSGIANVSLYIDGVLNQTNSSGINNTDYIFSKTIAIGTHNWTCSAEDNDGNVTTATYRSFTIEQQSQSYGEVVEEAHGIPVMGTQNGDNEGMTFTTKTDANSYHFSGAKIHDQANISHLCICEGIYPNNWSECRNNALQRSAVSGKSASFDVNLTKGTKYYIIACGDTQGTETYSTDPNPAYPIEGVNIWWNYSATNEKTNRMYFIESVNISNSSASIDNPPSVSLNYPSSNEIITITTGTETNVTFNCTATDDNALTNVSIYIDGVVEYTNTSGINGDYLYTKELSIGTHNWTCSAEDNNSQITEISYNFTIEQQNLLSGLRVYYQLDKQTYPYVSRDPTIVYDSTGNYHGRTAYTTRLRKGKINNSFFAYDWYGYIDANSSMVWNSDYSIGLWFKSDKDDPSFCLFGANTGTNGMKFCYDGTNFELTHNGATPSSISTNWTKDERWHYLEVAYDYSATTGYIYLDGNLLTSGSLGHQIDPSHNLYFMKDYNNGVSNRPVTFAGLIDEIHIYNRVLSSDEITTYYAKGHGLTYRQLNATKPIVWLNTENYTKSETSTASFNCDAKDNDAVDNITLYVWNSTGSLIHTETQVTETQYYNKTFSYTLPYKDKFLWNCRAIDNNGNVNWHFYNYTYIYDTKPSITINSPADNGVAGINATLNFTINDNGLVNISVYQISGTGTGTYFKLAQGSDSHSGISDIDNFVSWVNNENANYSVIVGDIINNEGDGVSTLNNTKNHFDNLNMEYNVTTGNHDPDGDREWWTDVYTKLPFSMDYKGYHFIFMDSDDKYRDSSYNGLPIIDPTEEDWLENDLNKTAKPTFIILHIDQWNLDDNSGNDTGYQEIISKYSDKIIATLHGHDHDRRECYQRGGTYVCYDSRIDGNWGSDKGYRIFKILEDGSTTTYFVTGSTQAHSYEYNLGTKPILIANFTNVQAGTYIVNWTNRQDGSNYQWQVRVEDGYYAEQSSTYSFTASFDDPPTITAIAPADSYASYDNNITFRCNASDEENLSSVSLYINGVLNETNSSGINGEYVFEKTFTAGTYNWYCRATDNASQTANTTQRSFTIYSYTCSNCSDCSNKIQSASAGDVIYLGADITNVDGTCIDFGIAQNITFDCNGYVISGDYDDAGYGISAENKSNIIQNCKNISGFRDGIALGDYIIVKNCTIEESSRYALALSSHDTIYNITSTGNNFGSVFIYGHYNSIYNLVGTGGEFGILFSTANDNYVYNATISNVNNGTYMEYSHRNTINNSIIRNSKIGIRIISGSNNTFANNIIENNSLEGIYEHSMGQYGANLFYNNLFNNSKQIYHYGLGSAIFKNYFNTTYSNKESVVGYNFFGGNYWAYPNGTGFSETCTDTQTPIGICDDYYNLSEKDGADENIDWLPLAQPDTTPPEVNIESPNDASTLIDGYILEGDLATIQVNYTAQDTNLNTCWYDNTTDNITISCNSNITFNLPYGQHTIYVYANDSYGNIGNDSVTATWNYTIKQNSVVYSQTTTQLAIETIKINISYFSSEWNNITAKLYYNGTFYNSTKTGSGNNLSFNSTVTVPSISYAEPLHFNWVFYLANSTGQYVYNSSTYSQTVTSFGMDDCSTYSTVMYNFTILDEETQKKLNATGNSTVGKVDIKVYSLDGHQLVNSYSLKYTNINPFLVCMSSNLSSGEQFEVDALIEYSADNYYIERYNLLNESLDNSSINNKIYLYDLKKGTNTQQFKIILKDSSYLAIADASIYVYRRYIDEGMYKIVEIPKTDSNGETIAALVINDAIYKFVVKKDKKTLGIFKDVKAFCQNPSITQCVINLNTFPSTIEVKDYYQNGDFNFTLGYNKNIKRIRAEYVIPSGNASSVRLVVEKTDALGTEVCTNTTFGDSGVLTCDIPNSIGNASVIAKLFKDNELSAQGSFKIDQTPSDIYGGVVVFLGLFVFLSLLGIGMSDNPIFTAIFLFIGVTILFALNFVANNGFVGATATILWLLIAIILIIIKGARRT